MHHCFVITVIPTGSGGAMYVGGSVVLESCELTSNECKVNGGAVFTDFGATANLTDCHTVGNRAGQAGVSMLLAFTCIDKSYFVESASLVKSALLTSEALLKSWAWIHVCTLLPTNLFQSSTGCSLWVWLQQHIYTA
jgi:hypothetical protein